MYLAIPYQVACNMYPKLVDQVLNNLRKGKSKFRTAKPEELNWGFSWAVAIRGMSFSEMLTQAGEPRPEKTEEETLKEYEENATIKLVAGGGRSAWYSEGEVYPFPPEIADMVRKNYQEDQAETNALLKQLGKSPGFMALRIGR